MNSIGVDILAFIVVFVGSYIAIKTWQNRSLEKKIRELEQSDKLKKAEDHAKNTPLKDLINEFDAEFESFKGNGNKSKPDDNH